MDLAYTPEDERDFAVEGKRIKIVKIDGARCPVQLDRFAQECLMATVAQAGWGLPSVA